jgi:hypothetical protein
MADEPMDKKELRKLLSTPLPHIDYSDTRIAIETMAEHMRDQHRLIVFLAQSLATQGTSILDLRTKQVELKDAIEIVLDIVDPEDDKRPKLLGFDKPAIVRPH